MENKVNLINNKKQKNADTYNISVGEYKIDNVIIRYFINIRKKIFRINLQYREGSIVNMKALDYTALTLVIIGAVNWGLIGFFQFDLVAALFGGMDSLISRVVYALVGLSGIYTLTLYGKINSDMVMGRQH